MRGHKGVEVKTYQITPAGRAVLQKIANGWQVTKGGGFIRGFTVGVILSAGSALLLAGLAGGGAHHPATALYSVEARPAGDGIPVVAGVSPSAGGASPEDLASNTNQGREPTRVPQGDGQKHATLRPAEEVKVAAQPTEKAWGGLPAAHGVYVVTAYCSCERCCGKKPGHPAYGITASGKRIRVGMCAADPSIPFGPVINVPGYGRAVVEDRGGAIRGHRLDIYFPTHAQALRWGRQTLTVTIYAGDNSHGSGRTR